MNRLTPVDPRSVANLLLSIRAPNQRITNLSLQKIIYFIHGHYLSITGKPLVSGYFEAWEYGPVHAVLYTTFKSLGAQPIERPAVKRNPLTGRTEDVEPILDIELREFISEYGRAYLSYSAGRLVELSHAMGSPWDVVTKTKEGRRAWGMRLDNELIKERFKYHKVAVKPFSSLGVPNDDTPPT